MSYVGKYQLVSKLATGGMAEVYLAKAAGPMGFEKTLVLKRILPHLAEDPQFVDMFLGEAKLAAQLNHPNVVQIFDFGESEGAYYLAMEYIDGPNLRILSKKARSAGVELPPAACAKIIASACEGLAFAHDFVDPATGEPLDLIHRDISPDNILLSRQGAVKVVDFGIAKAANQSHKTQTGLIKGKIAYMPPEQLQARPLDRRVDVYALGVVLYELLTGQKPFDATTDVSMMQAILFEPLIPASSRRPDLPQALVQILDRALSKVREQRYPDCRAFQADLEHFIHSTGEPMGAYQLSQLVAQMAGENVGHVATPAPGSGPKSRPGTGGGMRHNNGSESTATPSSRSNGGTRAASEGRADNATRAAESEADPRSSAPTAPTLISSSGRPAATAGMPRRRTGLVVGLAGVSLLVVGGAVIYVRSTSAPRELPAPIIIKSSGPKTPPPTVATPPQGVQPAATSPGTGTEPPAAASAAMQPTEGTGIASVGTQPEGGAQKAPEPVLGTPAPVENAPASGVKNAVAAVLPPKPPRGGGRQGGGSKSIKASAPVQKAVLEFRIRPYATVVLDGKSLGQTPLAPIEVTVGSHSVQLINKDLGKDVTRSVEVKAGQSNQFKYNLLED
ncbi:MAG TPA: protein kinase [Archangium sp.]